ncbi:HAD family hydrolase [Pedobacter jejuensis]|uniref:HAD family hydrolase n=1 Tax=Pedobacter jejuensis TaxID=1268550 RepID=UPI00142E8C30|nr:HAD-IA family hydrolase [Pedobacter jejuensis]
MHNISLNNLEVVVFDVDGTLYNQSLLRKKMLFSLMKYFVFRPWKINELFILYHFRKEREQNKGFKGPNLNEQQYIWCRQKVNQPIDKIKEVVSKWIFNYPNQFLKACTYPGIHLLFKSLAEKNIRIAIYSDYDSIEKMKAMELKADLYVSSTDAQINAFKPNPDGLEFICTKFGITDKNQCLFIGDRLELDGECAKAAGVPFVLVNDVSVNNSLFKNLSKQVLNVVKQETL